MMSFIREKSKKSLKIKNFGGLGGWYFKKLFPRLASFMYIKVNFILRRGKSKQYIKWFLSHDEIPKPMIVEIETINRCNSACEFCPANKDNDKRPFAKMSNETFHKIISDLKVWDYQGMISLYINNEPFLDKRIMDFHRIVRQELPQCRVKLFTNGTLMTLEKFKEIMKYVDYLVINNYGETMDLHPNVKIIAEEVEKNKEVYQGKEIIINVRYIKDILTNRAGEAPNKKGNLKIIDEPCIMPYTDLAVFSNGYVGICCNDATEKTRIANVNECTLQEIWEKQCQDIRIKMKNGRDGMSFCSHCDTMDSGFRLKQIKKLREYRQ